ncbi:MAG TPA: hypothetical protein VKB81_08470 [Nitrospira sp.]|nr:hypothetical protein [Nitrospira sp.]
MTQELEKESRLITGQHGGKRIGASRKKGSHGKVTKAMREKVLLSGKGPLYVLMSFMRQPEPVGEAGENILAFIARYKMWVEYRFEAAKAAAPLRASPSSGRGDVREGHEISASRQRSRKPLYRDHCSYEIQVLPSMTIPLHPKRKCPN